MGRLVNAPQALLALELVAVVLAGCPSSTERQQQQLATCSAARAAYGNDIAACLIVRYGWPPEDARARATPIVQRERELADSLARAERARLDSIQDSITTAVAKAHERARDLRLAPLARWANCIFRQDSVAPGGEELVAPCRKLFPTKDVDIDEFFAARPNLNSDQRELLTWALSMTLARDTSK